MIHTLADGLPPFCHAEHPLSGDVILIERGEPGYYVVESTRSIDDLNRALAPEPTPLQVKAMLVGCMFGWHVPAADPAYLREHDGSVS